MVSILKGLFLYLPLSSLRAKTEFPLFLFSWHGTGIESKNFVKRAEAK